MSQFTDDQADDFGEWEPPAPTGWEIRSDREADWALAKYARAEQEITRLRELAAEEIARINQRVEQAVAPLLRTIDFFGDHLARYHQQLIEADKAGPTYKLLNGDLTCRKLPARVEIIDLDLVTDYDDGLLRVKVEPDKRKILERAKAGEVIPGVELVTGEVSFKPKPGKHEQPAWLPMPDEDVAA